LLMICSAECRFLAMFSCLPKCVYSAILSHKEWTSFWGAGQLGDLAQIAQQISTMMML